MNKSDTRISFHHIERILPRIIRKLKQFHTIDFIVAGVIVCLLFLFLGLRIAKRPVWVSVTIKMSPEDWWWKPPNPEPWFGQNLSVRDIARNGLGQKIAQITDVQNYDIGGNRRINISMQLKATKDARRNIYVYNYQPLEIGAVINLTFGTQNVRGVVTYIGDDAPLVEKVIDAKVLFVYPWVATTFTKGLEAKDSVGRTVAKIEDVTVENSQSYELTDTNGRIILIHGEDPMRKNVSLRLRIKAKRYNDVFFYIDGAQIKVGNGIHIEFPQTTVQYAEIVNIVE